MTHIHPDAIQRFLADEADLMEREAVTEHLSRCDDCAALLSAIAADDDSLADSLRLEAHEAEWVASIDLTERVLAGVRPWYREPGTVITGLVVAVPALWAMEKVGAVLGSRLTIEHPVGFIIDMLRGVIPATLRLLSYLSQGGMLTTIWPLLLIATGVLVYQLHHTKEERTDA